MHGIDPAEPGDPVDGHGQDFAQRLAGVQRIAAGVGAEDADGHHFGQAGEQGVLFLLVVLACGGGLRHRHRRCSGRADSLLAQILGKFEELPVHALQVLVRRLQCQIAFVEFDAFSAQAFKLAAQFIDRVWREINAAGQDLRLAARVDKCRRGGIVGAGFRVGKVRVRPCGHV